MKKLKVLMMSFLLLFCVAAFWGCQQGQEDAVPDGTTDVVVGAEDPVGDDEDDDSDDDD